MIPQRATWSSALFITRDGVARRRYYDFVKQRFYWDAETAPLVYDADGTRVGLTIQNWWTPLETCVLMAWKHRQPGTDAHFVLDDEGRPKWKHGDDGEEEGDIKGETWRRLRMRVGCIPIDAAHKISSEGRLQSPSGAVTRGFFCYARFWAAADHGFLIDLTTASGLHPLTLRPRLREALECMLSGESPDEFADATAVQLSTAWSNFNTALCQSAQHVDKEDLLQIARDLVPRDMWKLLRSMERDGDPVLSGPLSELMALVEGTVKEDGPFSDCDDTTKWGSLRFARTVLASRS